MKTQIIGALPGGACRRSQCPRPRHRCKRRIGSSQGRSPAQDWSRPMLPCRAGRANLQSPAPAPSPREMPDETRPRPRRDRPGRRLRRHSRPTPRAARPSGSPIRAGPTSPRPTPSPARCSTALGYEPEVKTLSVPIGYQAMKDGEIDVFLGNWMPAQQHFRDDLDSRQGRRGDRPEPRGRQVHPGGPDRGGDRARRRRLQGPRRPRRRLRRRRSTASRPARRPTRACRR